MERILRRPLDAAMGATLDGLAGESLFRSSGFLALWRARGGRPVVWTLESDGETVAALGGVEFGHVPLDRFASLPDGCPGGVATHARGRERERHEALLRAAVARHGYARIHVFESGQRVAADEVYRLERQLTRRVPIGAGGWWPAEPKLCAQIRTGARHGLVTTAYDPRRHRDAFLDLVAATYRRHGVKPRYAPVFYDALAVLAARDPRVWWRCAEHQGWLVAAQVYLVEGEVMHAWQSCFDRRQPWLKASPFLRHAVALEAAARGVTWLDLGATPAGALGLAAYKRRWGGAASERVVRTRATALGALAEAYRRWRDATPGSPERTEPAPIAPVAGRPALRLR